MTQHKRFKILSMPGKVSELFRRLKNWSTDLSNLWILKNRSIVLSDFLRLKNWSRELSDFLRLKNRSAKLSHFWWLQRWSIQKFWQSKKIGTFLGIFLVFFSHNLNLSFLFLWTIFSCTFCCERIKIMDGRWPNLSHVQEGWHWVWYQVLFW